MTVDAEGDTARRLRTCADRQRLVQQGRPVVRATDEGVQGRHVQARGYADDTRALSQRIRKGTRRSTQHGGAVRIAGQAAGSGRPHLTCHRHARRALRVQQGLRQPRHAVEPAAHPRTARTHDA